jgi:pilus assembly protein CpaB
MPTKFAGHFPVVRKGKDRKLLVVLAVIGIAFFICVVVSIFIVANLPDHTASARQTTDTLPPSAGSAPVTSVKLYTPSRDVAAGVALSGVTFREIYWPRHSVPEGAVRDPSEWKDKYAREKIVSGTPLIDKNLSAYPQSSGLDQLLKPNMRGITIQVDAESGLEGWILPNSYVDVMLTQEKDGKLRTDIIVQNARVLSRGGEISNPTMITRSQVNSVRTVTLEVTPRDALIIRTASKVGSLSLMLRSRDNPITSDVDSIEANQIIKDSQPHMNRPCASGGKIRIGGRDYLVDCDGMIQPIAKNAEEEP